MIILLNINLVDWELKMIISFVYNFFWVFYGFNGNKVFMVCYIYIIFIRIIE